MSSIQLGLHDAERQLCIYMRLIAVCWNGRILGIYIHILGMGMARDHHATYKKITAARNAFSVLLSVCGCARVCCVRESMLTDTLSYRLPRVDGNVAELYFLLKLFFSFIFINLICIHTDICGMRTEKSVLKHVKSFTKV